MEPSPCSVPTMNLVGMVGSYSRQEAPWAWGGQEVHEVQEVQEVHGLQEVHGV